MAFTMLAFNSERFLTLPLSNFEGKAYNSGMDYKIQRFYPLIVALAVESSCVGQVVVRRHKSIQAQ